MGHLKGQPPPPQTMFSKENQPQHGRGANKMPTVNSLRVALAEGEKRLSVREVKSIFSRILCFMTFRLGRCPIVLMCLIRKQKRL